MQPSAATPAAIATLQALTTTYTVTGTDTADADHPWIRSSVAT